MPMKPVIIIYGATSFTAKQVLTYLDDHPDAASFDYLIAGRNADKLNKVKSGLSRVRGVRVVALDDVKAVEGLVGEGEVVINCAGPYSKHNAEALIQACTNAGKHYLDLSAEAPWLATTIIPKYDFLASKTGACIVPSCGFDSVPTDMTVYHALRTLQQTYPTESITSSTSFFSLRGTFSGGTLETAALLAEIPRKDRQSGEWALVSGDKQRSRQLHLTYSETHPARGTPIYGSFFFMYPYNRTILRRSWFLSRSFDTASASPLDASRTTRSRTRSQQASASDSSMEPRHGDVLQYDEAIKMRSWLQSWAVGLLMAVALGLFMGSGLVRKLVKRALPAGTGAPREKLEQGWARVVNISHTTRPDLQVVTRMYARGDPGYLSTAYMIAECALCLVVPPPKGSALPPLAARGGVLTPSTAFGTVLVERMRKSGLFELDSEIVEVDPKESRKER